jgi:conjugative transposon TraN protein
MKLRIRVLAIIFALACLASRTQAQWTLQATQAEQEIITSHPLEITTNKTSSIIFPALIKNVDKGSKDVLVQRAKEVGNVLQIKAAKENFAETNLTVITADGTLHHFTVNYSKEPVSLTFDMHSMGTGGAAYQSKLIFSTEMTETRMEEYCAAIVSSKRITHFKNESKYKVGLALLGIYIKDNVIFYRMRIRNASNINYDIDFLKFYVRDNARIKRTASQEVEAKAIYRYGDVATVAGKSEAEIVFALEKFTIPDSKHLAVELFEKNGGRHYTLRIKNKAIVKAKLLN